MITSIFYASLVSAALGVGVLLAMTGVVTITTAGNVATGADRRHYRRVGAAMCVIGLVMFVAGTMGAGALMV